MSPGSEGQALGLDPSAQAGSNNGEIDLQSIRYTHEYMDRVDRDPSRIGDISTLVSTLEKSGASQDAMLMAYGAYLGKDNDPSRRHRALEQVGKGVFGDKFDDKDIVKFLQLAGDYADQMAGFQDIDDVSQHFLFDGALKATNSPDFPKDLQSGAEALLASTFAAKNINQRGAIIDRFLKR